MRTVAIIGAGPGGLTAARWLRKEGFEAVLFDQGDRLGGQWTGEARHSGVWPSMRTNTSRVMTAFSDLRHASGTSVYPSNQAIASYLKRYAEEFDLMPRLRLRTRVLEIGRDAGVAGWAVRYAGPEGATREEIFSRVVVAIGRYHKPKVPDVPGLESFSGQGGVCHTFEYKQPERFRDMRVLVAGCSISALEIAADLAMLGAARVVSTNRRQRYVLHKTLAGVPADQLAFTRFAALAEESLPPEVVARNLKEFIIRSSGSPEQFGAPKPAENIFEAGITMCQNFLPLVAEGRIEVKPWMSGVGGQTVHFADGTSEEFDAIIFGTGYEIGLPFLDRDLRETLAVDAEHIDLHQFTFHPDLPGLAFLGIHDQIGPYFPVAELQARWISYVWSGAIPAPSRDEMEAGLAAYRGQRGKPQAVPMHRTAVRFARAAGVEPDYLGSPELARAIFFGPLTPMSFRLSGRDALLDAGARLAEEAAAYGAVRSPELTAEQRSMLLALAAARKDTRLGGFVEHLPAAGARASSA